MAGTRDVIVHINMAKEMLKKVFKLKKNFSPYDDIDIVAAKKL